MSRGSSVSAARPFRVVVGVASVLLLGSVVVGCAPFEPGPAGSGTAPPPAPQSTAPSAQASAPAESEPQAPEPGESGEVALAPFAAVVARVWSSADRDHGRAYIDALVQAGFSKEHMQVTADRSTVGNPAESIQFSVAWNDSECLVGQVGPSTGEPTSAVLPRLADGACLAGKTRSIDW